MGVGLGAISVKYLEQKQRGKNNNFFLLNSMYRLHSLLCPLTARRSAVSLSSMTEKKREQ